MGEGYIAAMKASHEQNAVKDALELELREYALNEFVKVEIVVPTEEVGAVSN